MMDMEHMRSNTGVVADLSNWKGINMNGFKQLKITSKERVVGEESVDEEPSEQAEIHLPEKKAEQRPEKNKPEETLSGRNDLEAIKRFNEIMVDPVDLKKISVGLLPTVDKVKPEEYETLCEKAIDLAACFLKVWDKKVQICEV